MNEKITELERLFRQLAERVDTLEEEINPKIRKMKARIKAHNEMILNTEQSHDSFCQYISQKFSGQFVPNHIIQEEYFKIFPQQSKTMTTNTLNRILRQNEIIYPETQLRKIGRKTIRGVIVK